jgi:mRNA interferase RelE/StbE
MGFKVEINKRAVKALEKINDPDYSKIKTALLNLGDNPRPTGFKKLKGRDAYRIRVGSYRIIYDILDDALLINVVELGHRKNIYK